MNNEFFDALELLAKEKEIPLEYLLERIKTAIGMAVKRDYGGVENVLWILTTTPASLKSAWSRPLWQR